MAGEELFYPLREESLTRDIPVVTFSADATAANVARLRAAGVAAYLTRPVAVRDVLTTLDRLLPTVAIAPGTRSARSPRSWAAAAVTTPTSDPLLPGMPATSQILAGDLHRPS
jgi:DNA-binding response OmpR family regulator